MIYHKRFQRLIPYITSKRGTKNILWQIFFFYKDAVWNFYYSSIAVFISWLTLRASFKKYRDVEKYYKISFCITSMDRLFHLKKTLLKNIKNNITYPHLEFVLLDYNSQDGLEEWVVENCKEYLENGILKYHRIAGPTVFHMAHAKNMAHSLATGDVLCGLDADNFTNKDFAFYINFEYTKDKNIIGHCSGKSSDFGGRMFLSRENFHTLQGYDENFIGWGYEDLDFKHRAFEKGLTPISIPNYFLQCIHHSDALRHENMPISRIDAHKRNEALFLKKREESKNQ